MSRMKREIRKGPVVLVFLLLILTGCSDRLDIEDSTFPLALAIDLDENNKLRLYITNPVFTPNIPKKHSEMEETGNSLRESRVRQDSHSPGVFQGRKFQVIVLSKRLLAHENWFRLLDVIFRDSRNTVTDRIIAYDGPMEKLINMDHPDEPYVPMLLKGMVDTKSGRAETVKTTAQELHRELYEKGITPAIAEVELDKKETLRLTGTALLDHKGKYQASLGPQESVLLRMLQNKTRKIVSLTFTMPGYPEKGPFHSGTISFDAQKVNTSIKTLYAEDRFHFDIRIKTAVALTERLFPFDVGNRGPELERMLEEQMKQELETLIKKLQRHQVDPIGLGLYARAYAYPHYKQIQDQWGQEFARSHITIGVKVTIKAMGPVTSTGG
ncbi:Ger(x)C family spore germination protein [Paenibacillus sp. y28]|uniref:Ger(x)C family spore germination protein n=1 Tax=Paenibacillus sp. y28 TaxID=3129110 RepID=UPI0030162EE1